MEDHLSVVPLGLLPWFSFFSLIRNLRAWHVLIPGALLASVIFSPTKQFMGLDQRLHPGIPPNFIEKGHLLKDC